MYHSITFLIGKTRIMKNTWDDWHLIPASRPVFNPPAIKTAYIETPSFDGALDLTESLTNTPAYNYREGSFEFIVENGHGNWCDIYSEIMTALHGKSAFASLEDDPEKYYYGRFFVDEWRSEEHWSVIKIGYKVKPHADVGSIITPIVG